MTTTNWRTNLGGGIGTIGTTLLTVGVVPQLLGLPYKVQGYIALAGFILTAVGKGLTAWFAADAKEMANLSAVVTQHATAINAVPNAPVAAENPTQPKTP